jgi:hypothetical protein
MRIDIQMNHLITDRKQPTTRRPRAAGSLANLRAATNKTEVR